MTMTMDLIRHIAGLYSGKAIKGDFTQVYITGNEIWMAQQILASQHTEQAEGAQGERERFEAWWATSGLTKFKDTALAAWEARAAPVAQAGQEPLKLSDDVREFLQEGINSVMGGEDADIDYEFANQLGKLLDPLYAAPVAQAGQVPDALREAVEWADHLLFECGALVQTRAPSVHVYNKAFAAIEAAKALLAGAPTQGGE